MPDPGELLRADVGEAARAKVDLGHGNRMNSRLHPPGVITLPVFLLLLSPAGNLPVWVVGDSPGVAERGVIINFVIEDNKVRFEVNPRAAEQARMQIGSKLLRLAKRVGQPK